MPKSNIFDLLPLVLLFVVLMGVAWIGFQVYLWSGELADRGQKHMEKKNINFSKDGGLKVGVKEMSAEESADRAQKALVNTWTTSADTLAKEKGSGSRSGARK
ncbi:hypothetical protein LTR95_019042 [Oleoguttula sp. CCFEE 5521]